MKMLTCFYHLNHKQMLRISQNISSERRCETNDASFIRGGANVMILLPGGGEGGNGNVKHRTDREEKD